MTPRALRLAAMGALAALTLAFSALALTALNAGGEAPPMKMAAGYDRRAEPILAPATPPAPPLREEAARLSRAALRQFPYDTGAWLRLAYVDVLRHGRLTPEAVRLLGRSYDLVAVDPDLGVWRVRFALNFAQQLPPGLREAVKNEVRALSIEWSTRKQLRDSVGGLADPVGAAWLVLWMDQNRAPTVAK